MPKMKRNLINLNTLAEDVCARDVSTSRELNITEVKRALRHLADIMAEEWDLKYEFKVSEALRKNGMGRRRKKAKAREG